MPHISNQLFALVKKRKDVSYFVLHIHKQDSKPKSQSNSSNSRVFWSCAVICGFYFGSVLVRNSFDDWSANPVRISIDTFSFPIEVRITYLH